MGRVAVAGLCSVFLLAGCSGGAFNGLNESATQSSGSSAGARLMGTVHGGQQPIVGAHVYLLAAGTTGYGGAGIAPSSSNASVSLLTTGSGSDSVGEYVTTASDGSFSITGDYTCTAGQQVYLFALGGNPGAGVNPVAGLMAALGNCPVAGVFPSSTFVMMNEVSTVAAAYAMAGFATDATHVGSSGTALAQVGIANAFANAANLVELPGGTALATTPAGNGFAPQAQINTLGNILAACVNSTGTVTGPTNPTPCYTLFSNALSSGTTGVQPINTATAAINIAHNSATNIANLYSLASSSPPFAPGLTVQPRDFTVRLGFTGGGLYHPNMVAIDGKGNAWLSNLNNNSQAGTVTEYSSLGAAISPSTGYAGGGLASAGYIAIDGSGNAWIANGGCFCITELSSSGAPLSGVNGFTSNQLVGNPGYIAIDGSGTIWVAAPGEILTASGTGAISLAFLDSGVGGGIPRIDQSGNFWFTNLSSSYVNELSNTGAGLSPPAGFYLGSSTFGRDSTSLAFDRFGNVWVIFYGAFNTSGVAELSSSGALLSPNAGFGSGGVAIAVDGANNIWVLDSVEFYELSQSGTIIFPPTANMSGNVAQTLALDGSGDMWVVIQNGLFEFIGVAAPVVTPTQAAMQNNMIGARP